MIGLDAWTDHVRDIFQSLEIPSGMLTENVSKSVAMYCRRSHPHGLRHEDLVLLIARACCSINERAVAERVLESVKLHARNKNRWLEILSELHCFPSLLPYFSLGIVRPADWAGAQLDRMWILDLGLIRLSDAEKHEMMLYGSLRALIGSMAVFWDATGGEGVLGVKGLASFNVESGLRQRQTFTTADDLLEYIGKLFLQQRELRRWHAVPSLLNLDM
ncbi:MAG TPA: hypothetical protein VLL07_02320 [Pontiella sp.]|nr:hypothetical protein [Pontiella sp.]